MVDSNLTPFEQRQTENRKEHEAVFAAMSAISVGSGTTGSTKPKRRRNFECETDSYKGRKDASLGPRDIPARGGKVVNYYGDGLLDSFGEGDEGKITYTAKPAKRAARGGGAEGSATGPVSRTPAKLADVAARGHDEGPINEPVPRSPTKPARKWAKVGLGMKNAGGHELGFKGYRPIDEK